MSIEEIKEEVGVQDEQPEQGGQNEQGAGEQPEQTEQPETVQDVIGNILSGNDASSKEDGDTKGQSEQQTEQQKGEQGQPEQQQPDDGLTPPDGIGEKANERFQALANEVRELRSEREQMQVIAESYQEFQRMAQDSCNNADEVAQLFDYAKAVKIGDFARAEYYLRQQVQQFEAVSGRNLGGLLLQGHDDLRQRVENMERREIGRASCRERV